MPQSSYHINMKYKQNVFIAMFKMTTVKKKNVINGNARIWRPKDSL